MSPPAGVVCAKCGQGNGRGQSVCVNCGAHLHVVCHHCGQRNPRQNARCAECGHKLHRALAKRVVRGLFGKRTLQIVLLLLAIAFGFFLITYFANWQPPR